MNVSPSLLLLLAAGCATTLGATAQSTFSDQYHCAQPVVTPRPDVSKPGIFDAYEVTGCGHDTVYTCDAVVTSGRPLDSTQQNVCVPGEGYCQGPGCTTDFKSAARDAFSAANSCPGDRVELAPRPAPAPPPDVAADGARLALWQQTHESHASDFDVQGCGVKSALSCVPQPPAAPQCAVADAGL